MKRSRLWNQDITVGVPVTSDGKVVGTISRVVERPQKLARSSGKGKNRVTSNVSEDRETRTSTNRKKSIGRGKEITSSGREKPANSSGKKGKEKSELNESGLVDPVDTYLAQVLEVVPDVQPDFARNLLYESASTEGSGAARAVVSFLLEQTYPKVEHGDGKPKKDSTFVSSDYTSNLRTFMGGQFYTRLALNQLRYDFPQVPSHHVSRFFAKNNYLYVPTYFALRNELMLGRVRVDPDKGITGTILKYELQDAEFERERSWLVELLREEFNSNRREENQEQKEYRVECGCCFDTEEPSRTVQCPDGHWFCKGCVSKLAETEIVRGNVKLECMDQGGCKTAFADAVVQSCLRPKVLELYMRAKQIKEIEAAGIGELESCPFCDFKCVIENPEEEIFWCYNDDCGAASCRTCKRENHLPQTCEEAKKRSDARLLIEEAMSEAIKRKCPSCGHPFLKDGGCNQMTCPNCSTLSCYICRKKISGHSHFALDAPGGKKGESSSSKMKCILFDPVEERYDEEVEAARVKAIQQLKSSDR